MSEDAQDNTYGGYSRSIAPGQSMTFLDYVQLNPGPPTPPYTEPLPPEPLEQLLSAHRDLVALEEAASSRARTLADALQSAVASKAQVVAEVEEGKAALELALCTDNEPAAEQTLVKAQAKLAEISKRGTQISGAIKALPDNSDYARNINASRNAILRWVAREELKLLPPDALNTLRGAYAALAATGSGVEWSAFLESNLPQLYERDEISVALSTLLNNYGVSL